MINLVLNKDIFTEPIFAVVNTPEEDRLVIGFVSHSGCFSSTVTTTVLLHMGDGAPIKGELYNNV